MAGKTGTDIQGVTREVFLATVRASLEADRGRGTVVIPPTVDEAVARLVQPDTDVAAMFAERAAATGMTVRQVAVDDLIAAIVTCLRECEAKTVVIGAGDHDGPALRAALASAGVEVVSGVGDGGMDRQFDVDAGITDVQGAIAETGSLICCGGAGHSRGPSLVPPVHIALVRRTDIVADHIDWWGQASTRADGRLPSSMSVISGPSKTADIEGELVTGVHGPGRVYVLILPD